MNNWCGEQGFYEIIMRGHFPFDGTEVMGDGVNVGYFSRRGVELNTYTIDLVGKSNKVIFSVDFTLNEFDEIDTYHVSRNYLRGSNREEVKTALIERFGNDFGL